MRPIVLLLSVIFLTSCQQKSTPVPDVKTTYGKIGVKAVIEIPAGTNKKIEYNFAKSSFEIDQINGKDRIIDFLPYPANYGFIPGTVMDKDKGGDGDALDVLVIAESIPTGIDLEVLPIAALQMMDSGELDTKIIAVPVDSTLKIIDATNFEDFLIEYNFAQTIIKDWFTNYKGLGKIDFLAWKDEKFAMEEIKKWSKQEVPVKN